MCLVEGTEPYSNCSKIFSTESEKHEKGMARKEETEWYWLFYWVEAEIGVATWSWKSFVI